MNLLHALSVVQVENKIMILQASLRKEKDSKKQDEIKTMIIKLNGKRNDAAAKLGELK
jgi:hypothetical protein